ncbi:MAG TPA: TadE family protein [Candidatus Binataceae bacterium]|nr:TadE family protein [Candidatus Binataceae bacterium]
MATASRFRRVVAGAGRAQAAVEFAIILTVALIVLVVGVQFAIIGEAALALGQANYQGARWAAVNATSYTQAGVQSYMVSVASPTIGANNGSYLTTTLSPSSPCTFGATVTVSVSFNAAHLIAVPNPFLGIKFPTTLTNSESAFCEG